MVSLRAEPRLDPVPSGCVHHWARREEGGRPTYYCTKCPARVDFIAAREEHDRLNQPTPQRSTR